jgi:alcohol dehydrogenase class IV
MPAQFVLEAQSPRVVFGVGTAKRLAQELEQIAARRVLMVATRSGQLRYQRWTAAVPSLVGVFDGAQPHCPEPVAHAALERFRELAGDAVLAIGGGSTLGLAKYIAAETGCRWLGVPTTQSGSEMTALFGVKVAAEKRTRTLEAARASVVVYDAEVATGLPTHETVTTTMNCLAHCLEALYVERSNPLCSTVAVLGVRRIAENLERIVASPSDIAARQQLLQAGMIGGWIVSTVGIALHHRICHVIGGRYAIAHADSNSAVLPHVIRVYEDGFGEFLPALQAIFGGGRVSTGVYDLAKRCEAPLSLKALGVAESALGTIADEVLRKPLHSPVRLDHSLVAGVLRRAWRGETP